MNTEFLNMIPVLPSADVDRDIEWYKEKTGFHCLFKSTINADKITGYAVLGRNNQYIHLQWHAGTADDPMGEGAVVRIYVKHIQPLFEEFVGRGTVARIAFKAGTPWGTNEFGFYDLNKNTIFVLEDAEAV